jgi:hypothetical protein
MTGSPVTAWWPGTAAAWTFIVWGNRIGLLTGEEASNPWTWIRVGGSLAFGVALAVAAVMLWRRRGLGRWMPGLFVGFAVFMVVIWLRSAVGVLSGTESGAFKAVHLVLAVVSIGLGVALVRAARA